MYMNSWCGAPTQTGFGVVAKITGATAATLHVATNQALTGAATFAMSSPYADVWRAEASGLTAGTQYYWGVSQDGGAATQVGSCRTAPAGAASFSFWTSSCAQSGSTHPVFDAILAHNPDFGMHAGDLHYANISTNSALPYHANYDQVLDSAGQGPLYRNVPVFYVWDDHDYGNNSAGYASPSRPAAIVAYRQRVPHPPLPHAEAVYQTFSYGRVRFVMLDARSMSGADSVPLLGSEQLAWVKNIIETATESLLILGTATPWFGTGSDSWYGPWGTHLPIRAEIAQHLVDYGWKDRVILWAGDAHSISYDDGTHNTVAGLHAPIFQTAALDQTGSDKGGTYTRPPVLDRGQFGLWEVSDNGGPTIEVSMHAYSQATTLLYTETVTIPASPSAPGGGEPPHVRRGAAAAAFL